MKIKYKSVNLGARRLAIIEKANEIIGELRAQGYTLTLRQLYYRFVAAGLIQNHQRNYKNLGEIIDAGRLGGLVDWEAIEDRIRNVEAVSTFAHVVDIVDAAAHQFRRDLWDRQEKYVECWIEKDALSQVVDRICKTWRVPYLICRGYVSQSEMWRSANRMLKAEDAGKWPVILHLGDHDPSGLDMTEDIKKRLDLFGCARTEVWRLALNMPQVEELKPPPNPVKPKDSRYRGYVEQWGKECWELDALDPRLIARLIQKNIIKNLDLDTWQQDYAVESQMRCDLLTASENWPEASDYIQETFSRVADPYPDPSLAKVKHEPTEKPRTEPRKRAGKRAPKKDQRGAGGRPRGRRGKKR